MILDDIIAGLFAIVEIFIEGLQMLFEPLVNIAAAGAETVVGIFVTDFRLGRMKREKKQRSRAGAVLRLLPLMVILALVGWFVVAPKVMNRTVTFVAVDGRSLTYAGVIIHTGSSDRHRRTNRSGEITIPRFSTRAITLDDSRYVKQTWEKSEIAATLTVNRTVLGAGLDSLSDRLLRPARE